MTLFERHLCSAGLRIFKAATEMVIYYEVNLLPIPQSNAKGWAKLMVGFLPVIMRFITMTTGHRSPLSRARNIRLHIKTTEEGGGRDKKREGEVCMREESALRWYCYSLQALPGLALCVLCPRIGNPMAVGARSQFGMCLAGTWAGWALSSQVSTLNSNSRRGECFANMYIYMTVV